MRAILAEKSLAIRTCPLDRRQQQSITTAQREELLLRAGAETLLTHQLTAISFRQCRGEYFSSSRRAGINQCDHRSRKDRRLRISRERLQSFSFAADGLSKNTVFD